jgi:hypothetical protein
MSDPAARVAIRNEQRMKRAILWVTHGPNPNARAEVTAFLPRNPQPRPNNVGELESWEEAGWRPHSAGGIASAQWGGGAHSAATNYISVLTFVHGDER